LLCAAVTLGAAEIPSHDVAYTAANDCRNGGCWASIFDKGYLFEMKGSGNAPPSGLAVFDPSGTLAYQVDIVAPDGSPARLDRNVAAADTDGTVILAMWYGGYGGNGRVKGGGVVVLDRTGKQVRFLDTARFLPNALCFGPDHSIWVGGKQAAEDGDWDQKADYKLVRKYSADGTLLGSFLPRSLFPRGLSPTESGIMRASHDRIGIVTHPGNTPTNPEWVELDFNGNLTGRWKLGPSMTGDSETRRMTYSIGQFSFTADGRLFAATESCPVEFQCTEQVVVFDKKTSAWQPAGSGLVDRSRVLFGADGNELVVWDRKTSPGVHLLWIQPN
jgi:hypothetical protein